MRPLRNHLGLHIIRTAEITNLRARADAGDVTAAQMLVAASNLILHLGLAPKRHPMTCSTCSRPLLKRTGFVLAVAEPDPRDPTRCVALVICEKCGTSAEQVRPKALQILRQFWPELAQDDGGVRMSPLHRLQIEAGARHLHSLGPRAVAELLLELAPLEQVLDRLDRYRRISPALLRALRADRFSPRLSTVPDDRRRA